MTKDDFPLNVFYVSVKFSDINGTEEREKFIDSLLELDSPTQIKKILSEQTLHNLFVIANYLQSKIKLLDNESSPEYQRLHKLFLCVKSQFNDRIKIEKKSAIIEANAKRYLETVLVNEPQPKTNFLSNLVNRIAKFITGEDYIQMYEYYHNFNMLELRKTILLKKFSHLSETDQTIFLSTLFAQPPEIIKKVIATQSLDDLDKLRKHTIPSYQDKLTQLSQLIDEYEKTVKQASPHQIAEKYLNANKHLLKEIAGTPDTAYENCKIANRDNAYSFHLATPNHTKVIEGVHERVVLHYAMEHHKEMNLNDLKDSLFPRTQALKS